MNNCITTEYKIGFVQDMTISAAAIIHLTTGDLAPLNVSTDGNMFFLDGEDNITDTFAAIAESYAIYKAAEGMHTYLTPIIVILGWIGNGLTIAVMIQPNKRYLPTSIYLTCLAFSDCVILFQAILSWWVYTVNDRKGNIAIICTVCTYLVYMFTFYGTSLILLVTMERMIAIRFPLKAMYFCNPRKTKIICCVVLIVGIVINMPHIFMSSIVNVNCISFSVGGVWAEVFSWISMAIYSFMPFCALLTMNWVIIVALKRRVKYFKNNINTSLTVSSHAARRHTKKRPKSSLTTIYPNHRSSEQSTDCSSSCHHDDKQRQLTITLLLVSFAFLFLTLPNYIRPMVYPMVNVSSHPYIFAWYILSYHITNKLFYLNSAINFSLYCFSGSRFRNDLYVMMASCCKRKSKLSTFSSNETIASITSHNGKLSTK